MARSNEFTQHFDTIIAGITAQCSAGGALPRLLLHSCCGPCSSYVLEYLASLFDITVFYDNPNIYPHAEYIRRRDEQQRLLCDISADGTVPYSIHFIETPYEPVRYQNAVAPLMADTFSAAAHTDDTAEGGKRCFICYELRIRSAAQYAAANGYDFFTTTLSISPFKNAEWINQIGAQLERELSKNGSSLKYLYADFKKRNGFKRSLELSQKYGLYRQQYCGCEYSFKESELRRSLTGA